MKKIITVLFAVLAMSSMFAKPIVLKSDVGFLVANDERKPTDFSGMSDEEILKLILECMPKEINGRKPIYLEHEITKILEDANDINDAREIIKSNMNNIEDNVKQTLSNNGYSSEYTINYGYNLFPNKKYKGVTYKEGYYESVVITLGSGSGDNWWCVLLPPLCALESDQNNVGEVEYKSFIKEIINKYFKN